jgi:hypothetical protein
MIDSATATKESPIGMPAMTQVKHHQEVMEQRHKRREACQEATDLAERDPLVHEDQRQRQKHGEDAALKEARPKNG